MAEICRQSDCMKPAISSGFCDLHTLGCIAQQLNDNAASKQFPSAIDSRSAFERKNHMYDEIVKRTILRIEELLTVKGGEYALDSDRLANFRINGQHMDLPMATVWRVYAGKHWDALNTFIQDQRKGITRPRSEGIEGRIDDLMTYCILLKMILAETMTLHE